MSFVLGGRLVSEMPRMSIFCSEQYWKRRSCLMLLFNSLTLCVPMIQGWFVCSLMVVEGLLFCVIFVFEGELLVV